MVVIKKTSSIDPELRKGNVTVSYGETLNMGNYESARIDVGVTLEIATHEFPEDTYQIATKLVSEFHKKERQKRIKE